VYPATSITDLSAVDSALKALELQLQAIKERLLEETLAIPKAKVPLSLSLYLFLFFFLKKMVVWSLPMFSLSN
jgi:hypothetical protein